MNNVVIGDAVHFYRDKGWPIKRGPMTATVLRVYCGGKRADLMVSDAGGSFTEYDIPILDKVDKHFDDRYCVAAPVDSSKT